MTRSILFFLLISLSCDLINHEYYFDFDEVDHYRVEISHAEYPDYFYKEYGENELTKEKELKINLLT